MTIKEQALLIHGALGTYLREHHHDHSQVELDTFQETLEELKQGAYLVEPAAEDPDEPDPAADNSESESSN